MQGITIGTAERADDIRQRLDAELHFLQDEGIDVHIDLVSRGRFTFLGLDLTRAAAAPPEAESAAMVRHYVANAVSDVIVEKWEKDLIKKIIRGQYYYFSPAEQDTILGYADRNLSAPEPVERRGLYKLSRKSKILHKLRDYLDQSDELVVEGFVTFRLREYLDELEEAVDRAVDDFLMEREYREFVRLLKYFVEAQEPRLDRVHVLMQGPTAFRLVDDEGNAIKSECLEEFVVEMVDSEINYEDLLISALITLAPCSITLHSEGSEAWDEGVETIQAVFGERVMLCRGCGLCAAAPLIGTH